MKKNKELIDAFCVALAIPEIRVVDDLKYNSIPEWDSFAHMTLVAELEKVFDIMLDTDDILGMSSVAVTRDILQKHGVVF